MVVNDDAFLPEKRGACQFIAGKPAPTGWCVNQKLCKRESLAKPSFGYQVNRDRVVVLNLSK